jgi:hypothetical protein
MVQVIVVLSPEAARDLQRATPAMADARALVRIAASAGSTLAPLHPGTTDPALRRYFRLEIADADAALGAVDRLRDSALVEAAYVKPEDAMP